MKLLTSIFVSKPKRKKLHRWLDQYVEKKGVSYAASHNAGFVEDFINWLDDDIDIYDIEKDRIFQHLNDCYVGYQKIWKEDARKGINSWLRFWRNQGHKYLQEVYWPLE